MWTRNELKEKAKQSLYKNYLASIAVCFLIAILAGKYGASTSALFQYDQSQTVNENILVFLPGKVSNWDSVQQFIFGFTDQIPNPVISLHLRNTIGAFFNGITKSESFLFNFVNSCTEFLHKHQISSGIFIALGGIIGILYVLFVSNLLKVGENRFFMESRSYPKTKISRFAYLYRQKQICHPAFIMFVRSFFLFLWSLTIVGGIIKAYEYRMIPYLLAENPKIDRKKAFALSKQMMRGQKWRTFILDLSFLGWHLLTPFTFGLLGFLYVNPYVSATDTELYMTLRKDAIKNQILYYEELNDPYLDPDTAQ
jgi:uncharacterized membrane protein